MLSAILGGLSLAAGLVWGHAPPMLARQSTTNATHSMNVTNCPGYTLGSVNQTEHGLAAHLSLAGTGCQAFGTDITDLTIEVTYQSKTTLHVKIYDTANQQFQVPENVIERPPAPTESFTNSSDLVFNYNSSPFAFWVTRRSEPDAMPIFDTRISSLPPTPIAPFDSSDSRTAFDAFPLVFEDQYLQLTSALPYDANIYGLGEVVASNGFRRDIGTNGGVGTIQTYWDRDGTDPVDGNMYGMQPLYMEHRFNESTNTSSSSAVLLLSPAASDIILQTPPNSNVSLIEYRMVGGIFDFYFFSGPTNNEVIAQYGEMIGFPTWQPDWGFGFHLCRWGYVNISEVSANVAAMRAANIPLEVQWNDIDLFHALRDFTIDPVRFPEDEFQKLMEDLSENHQHYVHIIDSGIGTTWNDTDVYDPYTAGVEKDVFVKNPDGSLYVGQQWPGYSVWPDWFAENTVEWWSEAYKNWSQSGVNFSGIWLDMNEVTSFCGYSCGTGQDPAALPTFLDFSTIVVTGYPECYDETKWGPSGNMTINGTSTNSCSSGTSNATTRRTPRLSKRANIGAGGQSNVDLNNPPYSIHSLNSALNVKTMATNATHVGGYVELDVHNIYGMMQERGTNLALKSVYPGKRPFIIARSTFPSSGKWAGHWLGDNFSTWKFLHYSIQGILQFQLFQIPMVGADVCGFNNNTAEELCNRWMSLGAFTPFYRNHNTYAAISQEPYRWESVANASRIAIAARYSMLPYWYTLFANASTNGLPPVRALFYEFPHEKELFGIDQQWLIGRDILVTPVLTPGATTVDGIFPGRGTVIWRDWWTHKVVKAASGANTTLDAPLSHINVHIRDSSVLLLHQKPAYTIYETRQGPYSLLVSLNKAGTASGHAYIDDGESYPPTPNRTLTFSVADGKLDIKSTGKYSVDPKLDTITILGVRHPTTVTVDDGTAQHWKYDDKNEKLTLSNLDIDLNSDQIIVNWA